MPFPIPFRRITDSTTNKHWNDLFKLSWLILSILLHREIRICKVLARKHLTHRFRKQISRIKDWT